MMNMKKLLVSGAVICFSAGAFGKLPPAPPADPVAVAAKAEKDKAVAEKGKALQAQAEDRTVKNFQANMKKAGKPVPKPTPIIVAVAVAPAKAGASPIKPAVKAPELATKK